MENDIDGDYLIQSLGLTKHPEGGWYKETFRSAVNTETSKGKRQLSTSIYYLLQSSEVSKLHRLSSDEIWYFHCGNQLEIHCFSIENQYHTIKMGDELQKGEIMQAIIPAGTIFGACLNHKNSFALVSCMVSPGFDFSDFEMINQDKILKSFPHQTDIIKRLS